MSDPIAMFFEAWQLEKAEDRLEKITRAVTEAITYDDPQTTQTIKGIDALNNYVGMFSANAPGWSAQVIKSDTTAGVTRATVAFSGIGSDGGHKTQLGQYFVEKEDDRISRMVGFIGIGE